MAVQNIHLDTLKCSKFSGTDIIKTFYCTEIFSMEKHSGSKRIFFSLLIHHLNFIWKLYHHFFALAFLIIIDDSKIIYLRPPLLETSRS